MANQTITYTATIATMGDADDNHANRYMAALKTALKARYPDAEIAVERNDRNSSSTVQASDDVDLDEVHAVANEVWNSATF